jgi:hypothetical protein
VQFAKANWHQNKEKWNFTPNQEDKKERLAPIFQEMGYLDAVKPKQNHYNYALVIGATVTAVQKRIAQLENMILQGLEINHIIFLAGERPLTALEKEHCNLSTEREMVEWAYAQSGLPRSIKPVFIDAPMKETSSGPVRPGTHDTIALWLKSNPSPGNCLVISSQPYAPFHQALLQNDLPATLPFEIAAEKASDSWTVAHVLDSLARTLSEQKVN